MVGDQEQQVNVDLDVRRLADYAISPLDVTNALARRNALLPGGNAQIGGRAATVTAPDTLQNAQDVADTPVTTLDGRIVRVGDLASVRSGYPDPPDELVRVGGQPSVALAVMAKATSSVTQLTPQIRPLIARELAQRPAGLAVTFIADQPTTVDKRLFDFTTNLALGIIFATVLAQRTARGDDHRAFDHPDVGRDAAAVDRPAADQHHLAYHRDRHGRRCPHCRGR